MVELALAPLARRAWQRGVLGGEGAWLAVGIAVAALRQIHRRAEDVVYTETLKRGQSLLIADTPPPPTRRARRKSRRRAQQAPNPPQEASEGQG
ncbi:MAG: hypothetical protein ACRDY2_11645 [Acidimicrobiales bacterium]